MSAPGDVAKAFLDSLPNLDHKKLLEEARRSFSIVLIGDEISTAELRHLLLVSSSVPADARVTVWTWVPGGSPPAGAGKTELAIVIPARDEHVAQAREHFSGVPTLFLALDDAPATGNSSSTLRLRTLDAEQVREVVVPAVVTHLWDRRLALGRGIPAARDRVASLLIQRAARDVKVILGSVAGAAAGRNGAPTPATAQLLVHQAALIVSLGAVYGAEIEDRRALIARVVPQLTPTLVLDVAESQISRLAGERGGQKREKLYATAAAIVARPTLSASSTLLAGLAARRVFRGTTRDRLPLRQLVARTRELGRRTVDGAGHGAVAAAGGIATRLRRREMEPAQETPQDSNVTSMADVYPEQAGEVSNDRAS